VSKLQLMLASLAAAVPGGILSYFLVMSFIQYGGGPNVSYQALSALSLVVALAGTLSPIAILLFYSSGEEKPAKTPPPEKAAPAGDDEGEAELAA